MATSSLPSEVFVRASTEKQNVGFKVPKWLSNEEELSKIRPPKSVKTIEQRLAELTEEQRSTFEEFKGRVTSSSWAADAPEGKLDGWMMIRYLTARQWKIDKALTMLENSVKWWKEKDAFNANCQVCEKEPNSHMMQFCGWDNEHRPVIYSSFRWATNRRVPEEGLIHSMEAFNHAVTLMPEGVEQWVAVVDFVTYSHWYDGNPKQGTGVIKMMQDHFPERLCCQVLIDPPTTFWVLWKAFGPFIDQRTKDKVRFWYTKAKPNISDEFPGMYPPHLTEYLLETFEENKKPPAK